MSSWITVDRVDNGDGESAVAYDEEVTRSGEGEQVG